MEMDSESLNQMIALVIQWSIILTVVSFVLTIVLVVWPFWRIFSKAGFHGALSLLMLVPIVNMFVPLYLAFSRLAGAPAFTETRLGGEGDT